MWLVIDAYRYCCETTNHAALGSANAPPLSYSRQMAPSFLKIKNDLKKTRFEITEKKN
jgi:hypothetical protein